MPTGFVTATEVADFLPARGVPFRHAHEVPGRLVARAIAEGAELAQLPLATYQSEHPAFTDEIFAGLGPDRAMITLGPGRDIPANKKAFEEIVRAWIKHVCWRQRKNPCRRLRPISNPCSRS